MPKAKDIKKVLVIGSGPIVIGQAAEFDYAGAQACRVLKKAGVDVVLVNSNPATIMTDKALADEIYLEPLTVETVKRIIEKERPDSLLAGLGGQTGLTIAMQLSKEGFLDKMHCRLLGTNAEAIDKAEDRKMFKDTMAAIGQPTIPSEIANTVEDSLKIAEQIGYPIIVRPAFTLGGAGGGVAYHPEELKVIARTGLDMSPISQVLIEKYIFGWKEIEFETMRDSAGNVIAVCSMENFDPVGVHTGDSIVVAPAMTLSDKEFQMLRKAALDIISALGIVGGCNCQFALDPDSFHYAVIEVNPRVSRSSALASKATGYPIAKITAQIALGYTLDEIPNDITGKTCACFEPTVDYCVVKFPKWPFDKFIGSNRTLGTQMKATGEVMSIAPSFEMAIMKAVRGAEISLDTLNRPVGSDDRPIMERLKDINDIRLFTIFEAIKDGVSIDDIFEITRVDRWFLSKLKKLADYEVSIAGKGSLSEEEYLHGKKLGYLDRSLKQISGAAEIPHRNAVYKMVDTCGAEFDARTPYFYSTYDDFCEARHFIRKHTKPRIIVIGSGPIRIGQGIEFDYSSVHCVWTLQEEGYEVIIINNNPETVSTDYDTSDRLYFEPLTPEDVMNVVEVEQPEGVVVAFGGQTAIKLTKFLDSQGIRIFGTSAEGIDTAEDREKFDELLEKFNIRRPRGMGVLTMDEALSAAETLGYPVLLRPSYVIGGQNMVIAHEKDDVINYMNIILAGKIENPVLIDKYMMGTELEVDVISDGDDVLIPGIMEHVERAGVHSGDSIAVYPPYNLNDKMLHTIIDSSEKLARSLGTKGLVNIQYLIYKNELYVIEVNPRASRTVPYISKVTGVPMVDLASKVMTGKKLKDLGYGSGLYKTPPYFTVKVPVFSFEKLTDANSILGPEMKSTGEVLGIGSDINEALFKGLTSAGFKIVTHNETGSSGVFISVDEHDHWELFPLVKKFADLGMKLYATKGTAETIRSFGFDVVSVKSMTESHEIFDLLESGKVQYIIYTGALYDATIGEYRLLHKRALELSITCVTSLDTANVLADIITGRYNQGNTELVDINRLRKEPMQLHFVKMEGSGNDYIVIDDPDGQINCPEALSVKFCDRHYGIGADGLIVIRRSEKADAEMKIYNVDGSEGKMAGNGIRCVAKYLYDSGKVKKDRMLIDTASGVKEIRVYTINDKVSSASVDMGKAVFDASAIPVKADAATIINYPATIAGETYKINCVSIGNPHCVVFTNKVDALDIDKIGPKFENASLFPERVNTEFVDVINSTTLKMRVYERGNGETPACGTGACAAAAVAVLNGYCKKGEDISIKVKGGDLTVNYTDDAITLTGPAKQIYSGIAEY